MNKIGFGWKHSTHKAISSEIAQKINKSLHNNMKIDIETLKESCVFPDFVRKKKSCLIHGHFANIDNPSVDPPDAYKLFSEYTKKAIAANKNAQSNEREYYKRDKYLGYALHFLQDMLNPFHVIFKPLHKDSPERFFHRKFECLAEKIQNNVFKNSVLSKIAPESSFFESILPDAMRETKNSWGIIKNNNYKNLTEIAESSLQTTYKLSDLYLNKMSEIFQKEKI